MKLLLNIEYDVPERWINASFWLKEGNIDWDWIVDKVECGLDHIQEYDGLPFDITPEQHEKIVAENEEWRKTHQINPQGNSFIINQEIIINDGFEGVKRLLEESCVCAIAQTQKTAVEQLTIRTRGKSYKGGFTE